MFSSRGRKTEETVLVSVISCETGLLYGKQFTRTGTLKDGGSNSLSGKGRFFFSCLPTVINDNIVEKEEIFFVTELGVELSQAGKLKLTHLVYCWP